jgi:hypothetical protein
MSPVLILPDYKLTDPLIRHLWVTVTGMTFETKIVVYIGVMRGVWFMLETFISKIREVSSRYVKGSDNLKSPDIDQYLPCRRLWGFTPGRVSTSH